jgi:hypothetical protein
MAALVGHRGKAIIGRINQRPADGFVGHAVHYRPTQNIRGLHHAAATLREYRQKPTATNQRHSRRKSPKTSRQPGTHLRCFDFRIADAHSRVFSFRIRISFARDYDMF